MRLGLVLSAQADSLVEVGIRIGSLAPQGGGGARRLDRFGSVHGAPGDGRRARDVPRDGSQRRPSGSRERPRLASGADELVHQLAEAGFDEAVLMLQSYDQDSLERARGLRETAT